MKISLLYKVEDDYIEYTDSKEKVDAMAETLKLLNIPYMVCFEVV